MSLPESRDVTRILQDVQAGDAAAADVPCAHVHDELRAAAAGLFGRKGRRHAPQAAAPVNGAHLRLVNQDTPWESRGHFFGVAARAMRSILADHARRGSVAKRGGGEPELALDEALVGARALVDENPSSITDRQGVAETGDNLGTYDLSRPRAETSGEASSRPFARPRTAIAGASPPSKRPGRGTT